MQQLRNSNPKVTVARISVPKPQQVLIDHLRESILRGDIAEGDGLPSERDLVTQTGLSRGAVREALRTLTVEGLVQTRHGRFGGSVVTLPGNESMATAISRFVQGRKLSLRSLQETREALEPFLARLAAERRNEDDIRDLKALHAELQASVDNFQEFAAINVKWHHAVAKASGNELLAAVLFAISHGVHIATTTEEYDTAEIRKQVLHIHSRINDAIEAGKPDLAERGMRQHMSATHARPAQHLDASNIPLSSEEQAPRKSRPTARRAAATKVRS
ncbi:FadR/GntR family transcriptional regulator [Variovorax sp. J22R133]|uniref:FadR/GntR family transcriptional regulator n=1 Tax=Variovorax brevis TaxID=3053503 RepID=UPI002576CC68|nr:FadR/GntR family transcriptional regulator [Variovorax sp. J22R133]MDM0116245.1 FadR/GntR family transcriptional regulator [Variovorax sp. J22R133]